MNYPKLSDKICKNCQSFIYMKRKRDEQKEFCDRKCAAQFIFGSQIEKKCERCSIKFFTLPSRDYRFCSKSCANRTRCKMHIRFCKRCNKEFVLDNIAYERRGAGLFCSGECATRKYNFDETYFNSIDSEEKAYWLGFLYADGNVYKTQMTLKLQRRDRIHLENFRKVLKSEHPIHDGASKDGHLFSSFFIGSKKIVHSLQKHGMIPKKTFILKFPRIDKYLYPHFIRGYFDADGCISVRNIGKGKTWSIFSVSIGFIDELKKALSESLKIKIRSHKQGNGIVLCGSSKESVNLFCNYIYKDATIFLNRKREKFLL